MKTLRRILCGLFTSHEYDQTTPSTGFTSDWLVIDIYKCKKCGKYKLKKESK